MINFHRISESPFFLTKEESIVGYEKYKMMYNAEKGELPWYANKKVYWVFSMLLLGWLFRIILTLKTKRMTYEFVKTISR